MKKEDHCIACKTVLINEICPNCAAKRGPLRGCVITYSTDSPFAPPFDEAKERAELKALIKQCREEDEAKARALERAGAAVAATVVPQREARIEQPEKGAKPPSRAPQKEAPVEQPERKEKLQTQDERKVKPKEKKIVESTQTEKKSRGRPSKQLDLARAQALLDVGKPWAAVAAQLSVSVPTLRKALAGGKKTPTGKKSSQARSAQQMERKGRG